MGDGRRGRRRPGVRPRHRPRPGATPRRLAAGQLGRVLALTVAPDGSRIAVASHDGRVLLVERETGEVREVDRSEDGDASGLAFSPDSAWLAWSHPGPRPLRQLKLANTTDLSVTEATPSASRTTPPPSPSTANTWSSSPPAPSTRSTTSTSSTWPSWSATARTSSPSQRRPRPPSDRSATAAPSRPPTRTRPPTARAAPPPASTSKASPTASSPSRSRPRPLLQPAHRQGRCPVAAPPGPRRPRRHPRDPEDPDPKTELERYDLAQQRIEHLAGDADHFEVSGDGKRVLLWTDHKLRVVPSDRRASGSDDDDSDTNINVDLSRIRQTVDPAAEWRQMYDETGRIMRDNFWREDMSGVDWDAVLDRYRPSWTGWPPTTTWSTSSGRCTANWAPRTPTSPPRRPRPRRTPGSPRRRHLPSRGRQLAHRPHPPLGDLRPARPSPLAAPGVAVRTGDAILAVAGQPVDPVTGPAPSWWARQANPSS